MSGLTIFLTGAGAVVGAGLGFLTYLVCEFGGALISVGAKGCVNIKEPSRIKPIVIGAALGAAVFGSAPSVFEHFSKASDAAPVATQAVDVTPAAPAAKPAP